MSEAHCERIMVRQLQSVNPTFSFVETNIHFVDESFMSQIMPHDAFACYSIE